MKKLYEVKLEMTYYAYTDSEREAELFDTEAIRDALPSTVAYEVGHREWALEEGWDRECLVYHDGLGDVTLGEILDQLPSLKDKPAITDGWTQEDIDYERKTIAEATRKP